MYICKQPGCGYAFPERPSDKCPNCDKSPFETKEIYYSKEEKKGREIIRSLEHNPRSRLTC